VRRARATVTLAVGVECFTTEGPSPVRGRPREAVGRTCGACLAFGSGSERAAALCASFDTTASEGEQV
jgi:hypothetical protein